MKINEDVELFIAQSQEMHLVQCWSESYKDIDSAFSHCVMEDGEVFFLREQARQLWDYWQYKHKIAHQETQALQEEINLLKSQLNAKHKAFVFLDDCRKEWHKSFIFKCEELNALKARLEDGVIVPREPTDFMINTYRDESLAPIAILSVIGYKAMIEAVEKENEN